MKILLQLFVSLDSNSFHYSKNCQTIQEKRRIYAVSTDPAGKTGNFPFFVCCNEVGFGYNDNTKVPRKIPSNSYLPFGGEIGFDGGVEAGEASRSLLGLR